METKRNGAKISNAKIDSTFLGFEDSGVLKFSITLEYNGSGQGCGGYPIKVLPGYIIRKLLRVVGVDCWEKLPGSYVRVSATNAHVYAIGNLLEDKWFEFGDTLKTE